MEKIRQIIAILKGTKQVVTFGLEHALNIFRQTKGRYDGDETKAVPFAILATAQLLGAEVTIHDEGLQAIEKTQETIKTKTHFVNLHEEESRRIIEELLRQVKERELSIENAATKLQEAIQNLNGYKEEVQATLEFFTV